MRSALLILLIVGFSFPNPLCGDDGKKTSDGLLRKSKLYEFGNFRPDSSSYPMPFNELKNPVNQAAISTGYYFMDSHDYYQKIWNIKSKIYDTIVDPHLWTRILPGPRIKPPEFWINNPDGLYFFRNPADGDFFNVPTDSTDDAIAGPIPIKFDFYFNGIKYDSFYVSTNGIIALTNSRYFYDEHGNRTISVGQNSCYNPMSMDWFFPERDRQGNGLNDPVQDNFGYFYAVCGGEPDNAQGGIRARGGNLNQKQFADNKAALIAPFFGDLHLSQFNSNLTQEQDWGKVYFKRDSNSNKLIIYIVNAAPVRDLNTPYGNYYGELNLRPDDENYISANVQIILDKSDSSITIVYEEFVGFAFVDKRKVRASTIFRYNTTVGVHGFARHTNFGQPGGETKPWADEYQQYTHYFSRYADPDVIWLYGGLVVKFRQVKNILRAVDISYRVRKRDRKANLDYTEIVPTTKVNNFEILAGDERLGSLQPVGIYQNLSNNIQGESGVNFQPQQVRFKARCRIVNEVSLRIVYNRLVNVDSACLANENCTSDPYIKTKYVSVDKINGDYTAAELPFPGGDKLNGIPPYGFVQVYFPPFEPDEYENNHIGRFNVLLIADAGDPDNDKISVDLFPFDDTLRTRLFVMRRLNEFVDGVTTFHQIERILVPNTLKWVNIDAEVTSGDAVCKYPLPPRGGFSPTNNVDFNFDEPDFKRDTRESPVIRMTRKTLSGNEPGKSPGGDELRSFPIDLRDRKGAVLSLSIQRTSQIFECPRGWGDYYLIGPEPRTIVNGDPFHVFSANGRAGSAEPDELVVEFAKPSEDGINGITNIPEENWRYHPRRGGAAPVTDMPALSVFGAGGYMVGWLESDRDSALSRPVKPHLNGLRPDIYDDGIDFEFKKYFIPIPDTFINAPNQGAKNFRFRIKVLATNDKKCLTCIPDDDDEFFIDNIFIDVPDECVDLELTNVKIDWPYEKAPASQASAIPVYVKVTNNTVGVAPSFTVKVDIYRRGMENPGDEVYSKKTVIPFIAGRRTITVPMPKWNAENMEHREFLIIAYLESPNNENSNCDIIPSNDTNYTYVELYFADVLAYDRGIEPSNDVGDKNFSGIPGKGLGYPAYNYGGRGNIDGPTEFYDNLKYGVGWFMRDDTTLLALRFDLYRKDTINGYQTFFGILSHTGFYNFHVSLYSDKNRMIPDTMIPGSYVYKFAGLDDLDHTDKSDQYVTYLLPEPIILESGTYWVVVGTGESGLELGATKWSMGMRVTNVSIPEPVTIGGELGKNGTHLLLDKKFREINNEGHLVNRNFAAFKNNNDSIWIPFTPTVGNPGYAHLDHFGTSPYDNYTLTLSRGSWIPMIRLYFGSRNITSVQDDEVLFDGIGHGNNIELYWLVSESRSPHGFHIQKRLYGEDNWNEIAYIDAKKKSMENNRYQFFDKNVIVGQKYQYRLRIVDRDGAFAGENFSKIVTLMLNVTPEVELEQSIPNPAITHTKITYILPKPGNIKLEIIDLFGNKVKTIVTGYEYAGKKTVVWYLNDDLNRPVASGSYIVRLIAGNDVRTMKMTVVR
jgi:hypothetical protein